VPVLILNLNALPFRSTIRLSSEQMPVFAEPKVFPRVTLVIESAMRMTDREIGTKGTGGLGVGKWRIDIEELDRDPVTKKRRRVSRIVRGTRGQA
jgi:hypothetical protein